MMFQFETVASSFDGEAYSRSLWRQGDPAESTIQVAMRLNPLLNIFSFTARSPRASNLVKSGDSMEDFPEN